MSRVIIIFTLIPYRRFYTSVYAILTRIINTIKNNIRFTRLYENVIIIWTRNLLSLDFLRYIKKKLYTKCCEPRMKIVEGEAKKKKKEKVKILFVLLNQKRRLRKGEKEHPSTLLKAYKNPKKRVRWLVTRRENVSLIFSTIRTGCTWRLVKGLTHDALPCRSVECGSSTAAATPLYVEDKGTLFFPFLSFSTSSSSPFPTPREGNRSFFTR